MTSRFDVALGDALRLKICALSVKVKYTCEMS